MEQGGRRGACSGKGQVREGEASGARVTGLAVLVVAQSRWSWALSCTAEYLKQSSEGGGPGPEILRGGPQLWHPEARHCLKSQDPTLPRPRPAAHPEPGALLGHF